MTAQVRSHSVASGNGTAVAAKPSGTVSGDQLWAIHFAYGVGALEDMTAPPGWAPAPNGSLQAEILAMRIWKRTPGGTEPGSYAFGHFGEGTVHVVCVRDASTTVSARITAMEGIDLVVPTPAVPPASAASLEIRAACVYTYPGTVTWETPAGYAPRGQAQAANLIGSAAATRAVNSSSSGQQTFTPSPPDNRFGIGVSISIASAEVAPDPDPEPPYVPGAGDALYQYSFRRFLEPHTYLGHLDLTGVTFGKRISRRGQINSGPFSGRITIANPEVGALANLIVPRDPLDLTRGPGVIVCDIQRGPDPEWGRYWIVGATVSQQRHQHPVLELRGLEISAYWGFIELQEALGELAGDREELARELLYHMQSQAGANMGLTLQAGSSGSAVTRTYTDEALGTYGKHLAELTEGLEGFEHCIDLRAGAGGLEQHWAHGNPLGNPDAGHSFSQSPDGGDILDWGFEITPLKNGNRWRARGDAPSGDASTTAVPLMSAVHESEPHLAAGHPRMDRTVDRPGVLELETLDDYAAKWAATSSGAVRIWKVRVLVGEKPTLTPNCMGDGVGIAMINEYFPQVGSGSGYDERHRVIGLDVVPVGREQGADEMELILEEPAVVE